MVPQKVAGKDGEIFPRWADHLRAVLARSTGAQKPETGSPIRSATGVDRTPQQPLREAGVRCCIWFTNRASRVCVCVFLSLPLSLRRVPNAAF